MGDFPAFAPAFTTLTTDEQATLTLTKDGPVLGLPRGTSADQRAESVKRIEFWQDKGGLLTLPFPVYVSDIR